MPTIPQKPKFLWVMGFLPFFMNKKNRKETAKAKTNAVKIKVLVWFAYWDFCCTFCTMPSPPEASKARVIYNMYEPEVLFSSFFLVPEIISTGKTVKMPKTVKTPKLSPQKIAPDRVGITKPKE